MTTLKETLTQAMRDAMRAGDHLQRDTLRLLLAAIKQAEVDGMTTLDDEQTLAILQKEAKKRQETIADFAQAGRPQDAETEKAELSIIESYLPAQLGEEEIAARAREIIQEQKLGGSRAIGPLMKQLMSEFQGRADGKLVNQVVRQILGS